MNTTLVAVTIIAVAVSIGAVIALAASYRRERRRSEARIAILREMSGQQSPAGEIDLTPISGQDFTDVDSDVARSMFRSDAEASPWGRRIAAAAVVALVVAAAGYALIPRSNTVNADTSAAAASKQAPPLELLSLRHSQEEKSLVITGLVQNPRAGAPLTNVIATAFLFGGDGTFLASGRAPLDFSKLAPGDESPFVLNVPVTGSVARYRVGFRGEDGRVIAHIDRRIAGTLARTAE